MHDKVHGLFGWCGADGCAFSLFVHVERGELNKQRETIPLLATGTRGCNLAQREVQARCSIKLEIHKSFSFNCSLIKYSL